MGAKDTPKPAPTEPAAPWAVGSGAPAAEALASPRVEAEWQSFELRPEHHEPFPPEDEKLRSGRPFRIRELLALDPQEHRWVTRRWVVLGDPGAGKTTLLRHLAATLARQRPPERVPIFESLPRLMREPQWLLDRLAGQMTRAGYPAQGLPAVLDRAGQEGRLLLLLDGLGEVPREEREDAESLLRQLASPWPRTPAPCHAATSRQIRHPIVRPNVTVCLPLPPSRGGT